MSFESLTLENYGLELVENSESEDSDEDPTYAEKCISTFRTILEDIESRNGSSIEPENANLQQNQIDPSSESKTKGTQMVLERVFPSGHANDQLGSKTFTTIPASGSTSAATFLRSPPTAGAILSGNQGARGGPSQQQPNANPLSFSQASEQQFSSSNAASTLPSSCLNSEQSEIVVRHRQPPQVPPKPQIDLIRYSMANAKDDLDLDTILSELLELENQLSGDGANQMFVGITPMASSSSSQLNSNKIYSNEIGAPRNHENPLPPLNYRRNLPMKSTEKVNFVTTRCANNTSEICASPDIDSAYGDSSSTESSGKNRNRNSEISSAESYGGSLNTPSPTNQGSPKSAGSATGSTDELESQVTKPLTEAEIKAAKIREALEKMKEAKMKKIYVKFFLEEGTTKGLLVDERWSVNETMQQLATKLGILLTPEHAIVEEYPELHIKRIYEDHEFLVENIEDWLAESKNKLYFIRRMDKYCFIHSPQHYLLTEKLEYEFPAATAEWTTEQKSDILQKYFDNESMVPELEGWLMLKADGRKSWKKHYFVLRSSGLYYSPKGKKSGAKDLQCLMNVYNNQVYTCTDWRKKYKAPSNFGFAIKHPKIQVKTSKYIKYVCTEDEKSFRKWITALRIVKNGCKNLDKNFRTTLTSMQKAGVVKPIHIDTQNQIHQRLPIMEISSSNSSSFPTRPQTAQSVNSANSSRVSVLSRQTQNEPNTAFDRDDCGTIKRQPVSIDPLSGLSTSTFNSNLYSLRNSHSPVLPISTSSSLHSASARNTPTIAEVHNENFAVPTSYPKTVNFANLEDLDSDEEEQFPPPPEVLNTPSNQQIYQNAHDIQRNSQPIFNSPIPPMAQNIQYRNGVQTPKPPPILTPKPTQAQLNGKVPAPPRRSENTRLQSPALMNEHHKQQMDLFNELQYKIQVRHNQQIDTN